MNIHTDVPQSLTRRSIEDEVERLIGMLDEMDGDPDLEDDDPAEDSGDDEPSLGSLEPSITVPFWTDGYGLSLRTSEATQTNWAGGNTADLEGDPTEDDEDGHDREHDPADDEPSLGWTATFRQEGADWRGKGDLHTDAEFDPAESGIGDEFGLAEQFGRAL